MIHGAHTILYSSDAAATRAFFRDVLRLPFVDAHDGWLIFGLPPGEVGVHPNESPQDTGRHQLYLMCDDLSRTVADLESRGARFDAPASEHGWGLLINLRVPGAGTIGLYEPRHPRPNPPAVPAASRKSPLRPAKPRKPAPHKPKSRKPVNRRPKRRR